MKILFKTQLWSFVFYQLERFKIDQIINYKYCQQIVAIIDDDISFNQISY